MQTKVNLCVCRPRKRCCDAVLTTNNTPISHVVAIRAAQRQKKRTFKDDFICLQQQKSKLDRARNTKKNVHVKTWKFIAIFFKKSALKSKVDRCLKCNSKKTMRAQT